jgi:hypothetical protein
MIEITTLRICIGMTCGWPLLWLLVFDRWFFLSPLGLIIALGIPIVCWVLWLIFYRDAEQKVVRDRRMVTDMSAESLQRLKKRLGMK